MRKRFFLLLIAAAAMIALSPSLRAQTKEDCLACHSDESLTTERKGKTISLHVDEKILNSSVHQKFVCIACHTGFDPNNVPHKDPMVPVQCLPCHKNVDAKHPFHKMVIAKGGNDPSRMCKDCHGRHDIQSSKTPGAKFSVSNVTESCSGCHKEVAEHFYSSAHGRAFKEKDKNAPTCISCHSKNITDVVVGSDSSQLKLNQEQICISCHTSSSREYGVGPTAAFIRQYDQSVHSMAIRRGNSKAANCIDCHGSHEMAKGSETGSTVNRIAIPKTCGKCHGSESTVYNESIHGTAFTSGNIAAPVCSDCHGEHKILPPDDPNSRVSKQHVSAEVCSPCHNSVQMSEKFGFAEGRGKNYDESYHGLATKSGSLEAANCASCHGYHDIKPSIDPRSSISKKNLALTCGKCHPGANENFTKGAIHVSERPQDSELLYFIANLYVMLIVVTVGGMLVHNAIDFYRKSTRKLKIRRGHLYEHETEHALYVRMTLEERLQHGSLLISFFTLVITGFMLRYPDAWWVLWIRTLSSNAFEYRGLLHRAAAVVMILASFYHFYYISFTTRGRRLILDLIPRFQDARDAIGIMKYNLGLTEMKPKLGRFSYVEKSEYWALVWGTIVMCVTGIIMWFDNTFIGLLTKLGYDISRTVHFYEAWLATLSIIVWHIYFVIFNPDIYPMNLAWLKGTISEAEMAEEHPLELEEIKRRKLEEATSDHDAR